MADDAEDEDRTTVVRARAVAAQAMRLPLLIGHYLVFSPGEAVERKRLRPGGLSIGRAPPAELVIAVPEISRRHCRIDIEGDAAVIADLDSTNGTFVGGERLAAPTRLRNGNEILLGTFPIRYELRDEGEVAAEAQLAGEMRRAADYVRAILPQPLTTGPVQTEWWFVPSSQLGGDAFGYQFLDDGTFTGFVLDVTGHGIGAAMHAVTVANVLRRRALPGVDFHDPGQVAAGLNAMFPMEEHNDLLFTLWYFAYDPAERQIRFCAAGHHPSFLVTAAGAEPVPLWLRSPMIGMLPEGNWAVGRAAVPVDSRIYVFSDGAFEIVEASGRQWVLEDLRLIMKGPEQAGVAEAQRIYQSVRSAATPGPLEDDFSVLVLRFP